MGSIQLKRAANILGVEELPATMPANFLAALQTHDDVPTEGLTFQQVNFRRWSKAGLWFDVLVSQIECGELVCVHGQSGEMTISAPEIARWMAAQGETPSKLLAAWFKAQGVAVGVAQPASLPDANKQPTAKTTLKATVRFKNREDELKANLEAKDKDVAWLRTQRDHWKSKPNKDHMVKLLDELRKFGIEVPGGDPRRVVNRLLKSKEKLAANVFDQLTKPSKTGTNRRA